MSKKPYPTKPQEPQQPSQPLEAELPVVGPFFGLQRVPAGWVALSLTVQGERVVDREVLNPEQAPVTRRVAEDYLRVAVARHFLLMTRGGGL